MCDDEFSFGSSELLRDFGGGVEWVGGGGDGAEHGGCHEGEDELGRVREEDHDDVTFIDAKVGHSGGELSRKDMGVGVGVGFSAGDETCTVGELGEFLEAVSVEGEVVRDGYVW